MRPPAIERMGYYPTDEPVVEIIRTYVAPPVDKGRLFDPCAGEGKAAAALGTGLNCETWGVELSPDRAEKAQCVLDKVYQAPWQACVLSDESVSWLYLNPPYEFDRFENQKRLEWDFLKTTTAKLVRGGLLTYIIPQKILGMVEVAKLLVSQYEAITIARFPDGLYEKFKQVVVLAYKRKVFQPANDEAVHALQAQAAIELDPIQAVVEPVFQLLPAPVRGANGKPVVFKRTDWEPEEVVEATALAGVQQTSEWLDLIHPNRSAVQLTQPVMPLKKGHIAMLMASGMMGTVRLTDEAGKPMLIKGRVVKVVEKTEQPDAKEADTVVETYKDRFVTTVAVLRQNGIEVIKDVSGLSAFMKAYGEQIAAHVLETYRPLYNLNPTDKEIAVLDTLGTQRKKLPGQERAGLLPAQRHAAAAMARSIRRHGVGNMQGEMGTGKSTVGGACIELLDAYPALVLCPPHLVPKWIREIEEVIPGAHARELRRIGRNSDEIADANDVRDFLSQYELACETAKRTGGAKPKWVAVLAHTSAKYGAGWQPAVIYKKAIDPLTAKLVDACACPACGQVVMDNQDGMAIPVTDAAILAEKRRFCRQRIPGWELDADGRRKLDANGETVWGLRPCNTPLFSFNGARRYSIAEYIAKHEKGTFEILVADECLVKDTMVETKDGPKPIQDIRVGEIILSFNHATNKVEYKRVLRTMKNPAPRRLISFAGVVCTANHPIYTEEENYVEAQKVSGKTVRVLQKDLHDVQKRKRDGTLLLQILRNIEQVTGSQKTNCGSSPQTIGHVRMSGMRASVLSAASWADLCKPQVLFEKMQCSLSVQKSRSLGTDRCEYASKREPYERHQTPGDLRTYEAEQPDEQARREDKNEGETAWQNFSCKGWKWKGNQTAGEVTPGTWAARIANGVRDRYQKRSWFIPIPTALIQSGYSYSRSEVGNRGGRKNSLAEEVEISRPAQNGGLESLRVDSVEVLECGNRSRFEQVCPDGYVYNLEVEGNNNYFANGVLVHNCHEFKSKSSDRGVAFHQLVTAAKQTLTLTGTFFGGKSTSIFWRTPVTGHLFQWR